MKTASKSKENRAEVPRITDGEWTIMKVVWAHKTTTAKQVVEALANETAWKIQTIQTLSIFIFTNYIIVTIYYSN